MHNVIRLCDDGRWRDDNKQPAIAFVGLRQPDDDQPDVDAIVWVAHCKCKEHVKCPVAKALNKACELYGSASIERRKIRHTL